MEDGCGANLVQHLVVRGLRHAQHRDARAVLPVAAVFLVWDAVAIAARVWKYNDQYITGIEIPPHISIEEVLFFVIIPLCGLLTYNAVTTILDWSNRR